MQKVSRDQLKELFEKVKHFRVDENFDDVDFEDLSYYSFFDQSDFIFYTVYEFENEPVGIRWYCSRPPKKPLSLGLCDICKKHRKNDEIISVYARTKIFPPGVTYRTRGFMICFNYLQCNEDMKNTEQIDFIYSAILKN